MDDREIKGIILNLHRRLTDNDRARLHFYLEKQVPRPLADDSSFSGTLRLMQNLFDEDKINEKNFTLLIEAFEKIQCFDAVDMLKGKIFFPIVFCFIGGDCFRTSTSNTTQWLQSINN